MSSDLAADVTKLDERSHEAWLALDSIKRRLHTALSYTGTPDSEQLGAMGRDLEGIGRELAFVALSVTAYGARYLMLSQLSRDGEIHSLVRALVCRPKKKPRRRVR